MQYLKIMFLAIPTYRYRTHCLRISTEPETEGCADDICTTYTPVRKLLISTVASACPEGITYLPHITPQRNRS